MFYSAGTGDLSSSFSIKKRLGFVQKQVSLSGERLATGKKNNLDLAKDGQLGNVYSLNRELQNLESQKLAINQARVRFDTVQLSLQTIRESASEVTLGVLASLSGESAKPALNSALTARTVLESTVSTLNQSIAGSSLFSGAALSTASIVDADQLIQDVEALVNAATDATSAIAAVDYYFNDPAGGFATTGYLGSTTDAPTLEISKGESVFQNVRADSLAIKETIQNLSLMAAVSNGAVAADGDSKQLLKNTSSRGLETNEKMIELEQNVGMYQGMLERVSTRLDAQKHVLHRAHNAASNVDLFEEATAFEELQVQLETSYKVLVRLSSLSLSNFLR